MPWAQAILRDQTVFARVSEEGAFVAEGGRVEIRYKKTDARAYRALAKNLTLKPGTMLPDSALPPSEFVAAPTPGAASTGTATKPAKGAKSLTPTESPWEDAIVAYADGACSGNPGPAGSGIFLLMPDGSVREEFVYLGTGTNNIAELTAILRACEAVPDDLPLVIHTDSQYSIGVLCKGWKAKANQDLIRDVKGALARRDRVKIFYIPGHAGVDGNEHADALAREAVSSRKSGVRALPPPKAQG